MADIQPTVLGPQNGKNETTDGTSTLNTSVTDIQVVFEDVEAHIRYKEFKTKQARILCSILYLIISLLTIAVQEFGGVMLAW